MRTPPLPLALLAAALLLAGGILPSAGQAHAAEAPGQWALVFENDTPQPLVLSSPVQELTYYWYMTYRVKNPTEKAVPTHIRVTLHLLCKKERITYQDTLDILAERRIEKTIAERPLLNWNEMARSPLEPGKSREGVAIFRIDAGADEPGIPPDEKERRQRRARQQATEFDKMTLTLRGLAERTFLGREGNVQKFRERVLRLHYNYVDSRWTDTKELKYADEAWAVEVVEIADRMESDRQTIEETEEKLRKIRERLEKLRKSAPPPAKAPAKGAAPPNKGSRATPEAGEGLRQALAAKARRHATLRATFTETLGAGGRAQRATGTACLRSDRRFAIERRLHVGSGPALKELRVFDGKTLWIHTATRELGDSIRRWDVADTRKDWHTLAGRPEVDFAALVNPFHAWRLFGPDLVHLGVEQLEGEAAHVFEVRPGKTFRSILTGPLTGELLGQAAGRRVRFWIGAQSGFQRRLRIYDRMGEVVASLECGSLELDAHLPESRFAYAPPPGVKVVDMNAEMAHGEGTEQK